MRIFNQNDPVLPLGECDIEFFASCFGDDVMLPGAFADSIEHHAIMARSLPMFWQQNFSTPIGKWTALGDDAKGLRVRGKLDLETAGGREAQAHARRDNLCLSMMYSVPAGCATAIEGGGERLSKVTINNMGLAPIPQERASRAQNGSALRLESRGDLEGILINAGLPVAAARKVARNGFSALSAEPDPDHHTEIMAAIRELRI